jgi:Protein of unknown function (DUF4241)
MTTIESRRRVLLALLGLGTMSAQIERVSAQGAATVETGTPQRLPLVAVDDLGIGPAQIDEEPVELAVLSLGVIDVPSGRLAGVDGLLLEGPPFVPAIPPGAYPLQIVLARLASGEERVAFAQIKLAERAAASWSNAVFEGEDPAEHDEDEIYAFEVRSTVAALFDAVALLGWRSELAHNPGLFRDLERVLRENRRNVWTWARVRVGSGSGYLVTAGEGNGEYGAYWGRDGDGSLVSLVLDFDLLDWDGLPEETPVRT